MSEEKYQIKYVGKYEIALSAIGFNGLVNPGDVILLGKTSYDELNGSNDWEPVVKTDKRGKSEKEVIAPNIK